MTAALYIVATPIGNLADISLRTIEILKRVDLIATEDTRHSKILLEHYSIKTKVCAYHEHNEAKISRKLIKNLLDGQVIALISDAGTPLINDPGYTLVSAAYDNNIRVVPVPGPCAIIAALSVAGLPTNKFIFEGFVPEKQKARRNRLIELRNETRTLVFYEAPHRIKQTITDMQAVFGESRKVAVARELTKRFEQVVCASLERIIEKFEREEIKIKGEFVVVVEGVAGAPIIDDEILRINQILSEKLSPADVVGLTAKITGRKKNEVYKLMLESADKA